MIFNDVYIISYISDDFTPQLKSRRLDAHKMQCEYYKRLGLRVNVCAMCYTDDMYLSEQYVDKYYKFNYKMFPAQARNILLREFYKSDNEYGIFADDDSTINNTKSKHLPFGDEFITVFKNRSIEDFANIDAFVPMNGIVTPYSSILEKQETKENFIFKKTNVFKGSLIFLKNIKDELYFDETFCSGDSLIPGEDVDFMFQLLYNKYCAYECQNIVLKEYNLNFSTWVNAPEDRTNKHKILMEPKFKDKWGDIGYPFSGFIRHMKIQQKVIIPLHNNSFF